MVGGFDDLLVCAPEAARSGFSCAFSATTPLRLKLRRKWEGVEVWSCNGTPVDCVKLALSELCGDRRPDLVIGGINHGDNASVNSHYSGTMGVTMEGCMKYIPSVAFSICDHSDDADFRPLEPLVKMITKKLLDEGLTGGVCLNVNFPVVERFLELACAEWQGERGEMRLFAAIIPGVTTIFGWLASILTTNRRQQTPTTGRTHGYVAITPTTVDVTDYEMLRQMQSWDFE